MVNLDFCFCPEGCTVSNLIQHNQSEANLQEDPKVEKAKSSLEKTRRAWTNKIQWEGKFAIHCMCLGCTNQLTRAKPVLGLLDIGKYFFDQMELELRCWIH